MDLPRCRRSRKELPWRKPETAVLIHGDAESSVVWYAWLLDRHDATLTPAAVLTGCPGNGPPVRFRAGSLAREKRFVGPSYRPRPGQAAVRGSQLWGEL
jgi:hypothetical protein